MKGGLIEFQSEADPRLRATGTIRGDGTFSLATYLEGREAAGAVPGPHKVIVEPLTAKEGEPPIVLSRPVTVEPRDNDLTVEVDEARGASR